MSTKFSQFNSATLPRTTDILVGLRSATNYKFTSLTGIADSAGNPLLTWTPGGVTNVNYVNVESAVTGFGPVIEALGTDINVSLGIRGQGTGQVVFTQNSAITLPVGTTGQRPVGGAGQFRYNSTTDFVEYWSVLSGAWEPIPATAGTISTVNGTVNQINATTVAGVVTLSLSSTLVAPGTVRVGNLELTGNTIESLDVDGDINLTANGAGVVVVAGPMEVANLEFDTDTIRSTPPNSDINYIPNGSGINILANAQVTSLTANNLVFTDGSKNLVSHALTDGQLFIGSTGLAPVAASLTAGSGVTITPGAGSITISATGSGGTVTSVSGTLNRISVTNPTTTPVIDIDAAYVGQTSITTLGTVGTGAWNATTISSTKGGTGVDNSSGSLIALAVTDSGAANAYAVTLSPAPGAYATGMNISFIAANANTAASTLNVNGLGAIAIKKQVSTALAANDILAGQVVDVTYDGTNFQMNPPPSTGTGTVTSVATGAGLTGGPITTTGTIICTVPFQNVQVFTSSGTFTPSSTTASVYVKVWGAGGGGGGGSAGGVGAGGAGGGYTEGFVTVTPSVGVTVTIGAAGTGGATASDGTAGGTSSFAGGTTLSATGGGQGTFNGGSSTGGSGSNGSLTAQGEIGQSARSNYGGDGGSAPFASGAGQGGRQFAVSGLNAVGYGGGGGGSGLVAGGTGGNGAGGLILVFY